MELLEKISNKVFLNYTHPRWMIMCSTAISSFIDDFGVGAFKLKICAQRCNQEVLI